MLRSVKYGVCGAVLAGLVGGTVAWTHVDKTVTLVVDGTPRTMHTTAGDVHDVLTAAGFHADDHDLVAPAPSASVHDGSTVVFKRGRLLHLSIDGADRYVWTTASTVSEALGQLGFSGTDFISVSRSTRLPLSPTDIAVRTPKVVTLVHDGRSETVSTTEDTVGQLLAQLDVTVDTHDRLSVPESDALAAGDRIVLTRVDNGTVNSTSSIPFATTKKNDASLAEGKTKVVTKGANGLAMTTYSVVYVDGKLMGKTKLRTEILKHSTTQVLAVGTKQTPVSTTSGGDTPNAPTPSPGSAKAIAKELAAARGWGDDQYSCLVTMWNHESGWNVHAANPSGAYGIPQSLPGSKMAAYGPDWQDNAETQIKWGLAYIAERYGTPCNAWNLWQQQGWY